MGRKKSVAILFGGLSSEYDVSCNSAQSIIDNIDTEVWEVFKVGITKDGRWLLTEASTEKIKNNEWYGDVSNKEVTLSLNRKYKGLVILNTREVQEIDCIFPVLHGAFGEDGTVQGACELAGIPYVGCNVAASACSIDKVLTKHIVSTTDVKQAKYITFYRDCLIGLEEQVDIIDTYFSKKYPLFVKPASEGSSVGISKVETKESLLDALNEAYKYGDKVLVEEGIFGREIEIAVLGEDNLIVSNVGEILVENGFYSYDSKYGKESEGINSAKTKIVSDLDVKTVSTIQENAKKVYKALSCQGLARVDFFLTSNNEIIFNEINTMPGFTSTSMYPKLMQDIGISYGNLINMLIEDAIKRG